MARKERRGVRGSVPLVEHGLERRQVRELVRQAPEGLEDAGDLALGPLELLRGHLRERAAQLIVEGDHALDAGDTGIGDAAVDLAREVDELIGLVHHLVHEGLRGVLAAALSIAPSPRGDNTPEMKIGDFEATLMHARVGDTTVALWRVAELARHVDRAALLAADEAPEPPYWAHLWSGAVVLATAVPRGARRVLELGCGVGLPGLTAARRGARVTFVDRVPAALAFVRASARANGLAAVDLVAADATAPALAARFDLVLAA